MDKFKLRIEHRTIKRFIEGLPTVPLRNLKIGRKRTPSIDLDADVSLIINKYCTTIENLQLIGLKMTSSELKTMLTGMGELRNLELRDLELTTPTTDPVQLPKLESLSISFFRESQTCNCRHGIMCYATENLLQAFKFNTTIEKFQFHRGYHGHRICAEVYQSFIKTVPNVKHLVLDVDISEFLLST
jgi:hypothetical protein